MNVALKTTFLAMVTKFWDSTSESKIINKTANITYKTVTIFFKVV